MIKKLFGVQMGKAKTNKKLIVIILITILAVSAIFSILVYLNFGVSQQTVDYNTFKHEFGNVPVESGNYTFSPPVSMYHALRIALEKGGWNTTSLENMTISAYLDYFEFFTNSSFQFLSTVGRSETNYSPVIVNDTTYRHIWDISINPISGPEFPPPGLYFVDAATAEIIPTS